MEKLWKKTLENFEEYKNKSELVTGTNPLRQSSPSDKVVTRHWLQGHVLTTAWWKDTGKVQRYPAVGNAGILGDFTPVLLLLCALIICIETDPFSAFAFRLKGVNVAIMTYVTSYAGRPAEVNCFCGKIAAVSTECHL
jgi:hypothetical protein